jgi:hypothetical protein
LWHIAPIEQNVNGEKGFYQLEYSRKASKWLGEFKKNKGARQLNNNATDTQVEINVSVFGQKYGVPSQPLFYNIFCETQAKH